MTYHTIFYYKLTMSKIKKIEEIIFAKQNINKNKKKGGG